MKYVMRWPARSAVVLLTGIMAAVIGAGAADAAGMVPASVLPPIAGRLGGLTLSPSLSILAELNGVFCTSPGNCWAVGSQATSGGDTTVNQVLRWNGSTWRPFPVPEPGGTAPGGTVGDDMNELSDVTCVSPADCWAVGTFRLVHQQRQSESGAALERQEVVASHHP
jgi:hypothetical protein